MDQANLVPKMGMNPVPVEGWSARLTPYQVEYVRAFGVRPERSGWLADEKTFAALEREAEVLSCERLTPSDQVRDQADDEALSETESSAAANRTFSQWWMALLLLLLFVLTASFAVSGALNLIETQRIQVEIEEIERLSNEVR